MRFGFPHTWNRMSKPYSKLQREDAGHRIRERVLVFSVVLLVFGALFVKLYYFPYLWTIS
jgi:hypothetical protein